MILSQKNLPPHSMRGLTAGDYMCWQAEYNPARFEAEEKINGRNLKVFTISKIMQGRHGDEVRHLWRLWVDPERGHFPVRAVVENEAGEIWKIKGCTEFIECSGGRWAPRRWFEAERNRFTDGTLDPSGDYSVSVTEILEFAADEPSGEEMFQVAVEPDKYLFYQPSDSSVNGETYHLIRNEIDSRWFHENGAFDPPAGVMLPVARNPMDFKADTPRTFHYPPIWAIGTVVLAAAVTLIYRFRKKR